MAQHIQRAHRPRKGEGTENTVKYTCHICLFGGVFLFVKFTVIEWWLIFLWISIEWWCRLDCSDIVWKQMISASFCFGLNIFYSLKKRIGCGLERDKSLLLECLFYDTVSNKWIIPARAFVPFYRPNLILITWKDWNIPILLKMCLCLDFHSLLLTWVLILNP